MNWPGEAVLSRLIETIEKGIGGIAKPWQIRREGKANAEARAHEMLFLAQAEKQVEAIRNGSKKLDQTGRLIASQPQLLLDGPKSENRIGSNEDIQFAEVFATAAVSVDVADAMQKSINLKRISLFAEEEAETIDARPTPEGASSKSAEVPNDDWFARWRAGAQNVKREEMQRLWGRLLAGEVAVPGSYSLHTVDFLSRMSQTDAALLEKVAPFATSAGLIKKASEIWEGSGVRFSDLLYLDDLGLLNGASSGVGGLVFGPNLNVWEGRKYRIVSSGEVALIFNFKPDHDPKAKFSFECFPLTLVGREILSLATIVPNEEYLKRIAELGVGMGASSVQRGIQVPGSEFIASLVEFVRGPEESDANP